MSLMEWKDSFSVGVLQLDADHRHLLDLINQLHDAHAKKQSGEIVTAILTELRDHVGQHCAREETFMDKIGYPETESHKQSHHNAVDSVNQLISISKSAPQAETTRQVLEFMKSWFATHVICTDVKLREYFVEKGVADVHVSSNDNWEKGIFQKLGRRTDGVGLRGRILILALIPFLAFIATTGWIIADRIKTAQVLERMDHIAALGADIGALVHEMQTERGMSSVFVDSKGSRFAAEIQVQRQKTDAKQAQLMASISTTMSQMEGSDTASLLQKSTDQIKRLPEMRRAIDQQSVMAGDVISYYTSVVTSLMSVFDGMIAMTPNAEMVRDVVGYTEILGLKESAGRERATLARVFATGSFNEEALSRYMRFSAAQETYESIVNSVASPEVRTAYAQTLKGDSVDGVKAVRQQLNASLVNSQPLTIKPEDWFALASSRINLLKQVEDVAANALTNHVRVSRNQAQTQSMEMMILVAVILTCVVMLSMVMIGSVVPPLIAATKAMHKLASGERTVDIPGITMRDEIGKIAKAIQFFKERLIVSDLQSAKGWVENEEQILALERKERMIGEFDVGMAEFLSRLGQAATDLHRMSNIMSEAAGSTSQQATQVAVASEQASTNVQTVAAAAEELTSSISEISRQVLHSAAISQGASQSARHAETVVGELAETANKIGEVVGLIKLIAGQTNLLALNATIEAARAGEAGKGFAVVANEVKDLANQTAQATEEITRQVQSVQTHTQDAVEVIQGIVKVIDEVRQIASGIASAVEEQSAATNEIARNVEQAAAGTAEVTSSANNVQQTADQTRQAASQVLQASNQMAADSESLRANVEHFLVTVRAN